MVNPDELYDYLNEHNIEVVRPIAYETEDDKGTVYRQMNKQEFGIVYRGFLDVVSAKMPT